MSDALSAMIKTAKVGDKITTTFGLAPATMFCTETLTTPKTLKKFTVMVFGIEAAAVQIREVNGTWVYEEQA